MASHSDTTPEAAAVQLAIHRRLGPEGRFRLAIEMSDLVRECAASGVRLRHPEYDEVQVREMLLRQLYGFTPPPR